MTQGHGACGAVDAPERLGAATGWAPRVELQEGLAGTVDWVSATLAA